MSECTTGWLIYANNGTYCFRYILYLLVFMFIDYFEDFFVHIYPIWLRLEEFKLRISQILYQRFVTFFPISVFENSKC